MPAAHTVARVGLGGMLMFAGLSHLTFARKDFRAQVPTWVPTSVDDTVVMSGVAEMALGAALVALPKERRRLGWIAALFFVAIFPGNVSQLRHHRDAFGLDTDLKRGLRLLGQPALVAVALTAAGAFSRKG